MTAQPNLADLHERARRLVDVERVEGLAPAELRWLQEHLSACAACAEWAERTASVLQALRSVSVAVPAGLAELAGSRALERAAQLRHERLRNLTLVAACAFSWLAGVASAPLVWRACAWLGGALELPRAIWVLAFAGWWLVPAAAVGLVFVWARSREAERT